MKVQSLQEAVQRYGEIDLEKGIWPDQLKWVKPLEIPEGMFPNWTLLDTGIPVKHISANIDMHEPLMNALKSVSSLGLSSELKTFDGCFNIRCVRGCHANVSAHSYGLAIDLNAATNPLGFNGTDFSPAFIKCFTDQGFDWGGAFIHRKDPMHFSFCFEHPHQ